MATGAIGSRPAAEQIKNTRAMTESSKPLRVHASVTRPRDKHGSSARRAGWCLKPVRDPQGAIAATARAIVRSYKGRAGGSSSRH
jgi:hypothetical protein